MTMPADPRRALPGLDEARTTMIPRIEATGAIPIVGSTNEPRRPRKKGGRSLRVDWPNCKAHGLCHELFPERIGRDEWGYPVINSSPLRGKNLDEAKRAVTACPTLALRLVDPIAR